MKKVLFLTCIMLFVLALSATSTSAHTAEDPMVVDLITHKDTDVGDVIVWNDADYLYVKFVSDELCIIEVQVQVDEGDWDTNVLTTKDNPVPGQFEAFYNGGCFYTHTFTFPMEEFERGDELMIATHAAMGIGIPINFESNVGDIIYGPIYSETEPTEWGEPGCAVQAYNWIGIERDLTDPLQIPECEYNPFYTLESNWGFGLNPTYDSDLPGIPWISTAPNTEVWAEKSWRKVVETFRVPGYPITGSIEINSDNEYWLYVNGVLVGTDDDIWNLPDVYTFTTVGAINTIELVWLNWDLGPADDYCQQLGNPNGLTYKGSVSRYKGAGETAWGCGEDNCYEFNCNNWATYFTYIVQDETSPPTAENNVISGTIE